MLDCSGGVGVLLTLTQWTSWQLLFIGRCRWRTACPHRTKRSHRAHGCFHPHIGLHDTDGCAAYTHGVGCMTKINSKKTKTYTKKIVSSKPRDCTVTTGVLLTLTRWTA